MSPRDVLASVLTFPGGGLLADAVLAALSAAGYVVVPKEPTEAMVLAAISRPEYGASTTMFYGEIYRAMLAAAQEPKP